MSDFLVLVIALVYLGICVVFGFLAAEAMNEKGRSSTGGFLLGFFLGAIGLIIALLYDRTIAKELERIDRIERLRQSGRAPLARQQTSHGQQRLGHSRIGGGDPVGRFLHSSRDPQPSTVEAGDNDSPKPPPRDWGGDPLGRFLSDREQSTSPETKSRNGDPK